MSEQTTIQRKYWDTLASAVSDDISVSHWIDKDGRPLDASLFGEIADYLVAKSLHDRPTASILEVGCGNGLIIKQLTARANEQRQWDIFGVDISQGMLKRSLVSDGKFVCCDAASAPFQSGSFDLVYMHGIVQYFGTEAYLEKVLNSMVRLLRPGGDICIMDVPNAWYQEEMVHKKGLARVQLRAMHVRRKLRSLMQGGDVEEKIGGVSVKVPAVKGLYVNPDTFGDLRTVFGSVTCELQPFAHKPVNYRKYRYNVILKNKTDVKQ